MPTDSVAFSICSLGLAIEPQKVERVQDGLADAPAAVKGDAVLSDEVGDPEPSALSPTL
jgi:hypothetical protein